MNISCIFLDLLFVKFIANYLIPSLSAGFRKSTGGPPLARKSLTRFPLTRILAYVRVSGGISVSRGPQYSPTNMNFM